MIRTIAVVIIVVVIALVPPIVGTVVAVAYMPEWAVQVAAWAGVFSLLVTAWARCLIYVLNRYFPARARFGRPLSEQTVKSLESMALNAEVAAAAARRQLAEQIAEKGGS